MEKTENKTKEILNVNLKVTQELYPNPNYVNPLKEAAIGNNSISMEGIQYQPEFLERTHFSVTGTIEDLNINVGRVARNVLNNIPL